MVVAGILVGINSRHFKERQRIPLRVKARDSEPLEYKWVQVAGPTVDIKDDDTPDVSFETVMPGLYGMLGNVSEYILEGDPTDKNSSLFSFSKASNRT